MMTQTHLLTACALLAKPGNTRMNNMIIFGALLPDLSIFILFFWAKGIANIPDGQLWNVTYWSEPWQSLSAISNSIPLYILLALAAYFINWRLIYVLALAALLHISLDFPFHADDAHKHFWPLTDWRFYSPFSYWDNRYNAEIIRALEIAISVLCLVILWRRFEMKWVRAVLFITIASYAVVIGYFATSLV